MGALGRRRIGEVHDPPAVEVGEGTGVLGQRLEGAQTDGLLGVGVDLFGRGVDLDHQFVRAGDEPGAAQGAAEVGAPGRVGGVRDHRQVRRGLQVGDGAHVEQVARDVVEAANAALAEDDPPVAPREDVLGGAQELRDGRAEAALEEHGLVDLAELLEQCVARHAARADLDHVGHLGHGLHVARVEHLGHHADAHGLAHAPEHLEAGAAQPWKE